MTELVPRNGKWFVALIVGCPADRYRDVRRHLAEKFGISAPYHVEDKDAPRSSSLAISPDVDFALIMGDFIGHDGQTVIRRALRNAGLPAFFADSRTSKLSQVIYRYRLHGRALPLEVQTSLIHRGTGLTPTEVTQPLPVVPSATIPDQTSLPLTPESQSATIAHVDPVDAPEIILTSKALQYVTLFAHEIRLRLKEAGLKTVMIAADDVSMEFASDTHTTTEKSNGTDT